MAQKKRAGLVPAASIEDLLTTAGFQTLETRGEKIIVASLATGHLYTPRSFGAPLATFSEAHATFLQAAENHPALLGCSRLDQLSGPVLIVHRTTVEQSAALPHAPSSMLPAEEA
jgi:hypothetical protein